MRCSFDRLLFFFSSYLCFFYVKVLFNNLHLVILFFCFTVLKNILSYHSFTYLPYSIFFRFTPTGRQINWQNLLKEKKKKKKRRITIYMSQCNYLMLLLLRLIQQSVFISYDPNIKYRCQLIDRREKNQGQIKSIL